MQNPLSRYLMLAKRWAWMIVLGILICGGTTYIISKFTHSVYQASTIIVVNLDTSSPNSNATASLASVPTYAQLLTNPSILEPVVARHPGMTLDQLNTMITVKSQPNTQLIELDVQNVDPHLAMQLANEISQSFAQYSNSQLPGTIQFLPAQLPIDPIKPKPLQDAGIGALVGLGLAIALIVIFEWIDDRVVSIKEFQQLLGMNILGIIPRLSRKQLRAEKFQEIPTWVEAYRMLCARLNNAKMDNQFKLVMVTSGIESEGKTTVAANLAIFLAKAGKRVLLVEADLRRPTLDKHFHLEKRLGFSSVVMGAWSNIEEKLNGQPTNIPDLRVVTAEATLSNSADLLQSPRMSQVFEYFKRAPFDYIIFDTPPLLPLADAQILATYVEATVLVVDESKMTRKELLRIKDVLNKTHTLLLGAVLNKSQQVKRTYASHYYTDLLEEQVDIDMTKTINMPQVESPVISPPEHSLQNEHSRFLDPSTSSGRIKKTNVVKLNGHANSSDPSRREQR